MISHVAGAALPLQPDVAYRAAWSGWNDFLIPEQSIPMSVAKESIEKIKKDLESAAAVVKEEISVCTAQVAEADRRLKECNVEAQSVNRRLAALVTEGKRIRASLVALGGGAQGTLKSPQPDDRFACPVEGCGKTFPYWSYYARHIERRHKEFEGRPPQPVSIGAVQTKESKNETLH